MWVRALPLLGDLYPQSQIAPLVKEIGVLVLWVWLFRMELEMTKGPAFAGPLALELLP